MRTLLCWLLMIPTLVFSAFAQEQPTPGLPKGIARLVDDVRLGVRVEGGFFRSQMSVSPLAERGLRYLNRSVSSDISPATTPIYGISAGLRWAGNAEVFGGYRLNEGMGPEAALMFHDGQRAVPSEYDLRQWEIRGHYFLEEIGLPNVGLGAIYRSDQVLLSRISSFVVANNEVNSTVFSGSIERQTLALYVPARLRLGSQTTLFGRVGASIYGRSDESYNTRFTFYQDPERPEEIYPVPPDQENASIDPGSVDLNRQFARLGLERPFLGLTWRFFLAGERLNVGDVSEEWRGGARLQVGLPF